MRIRQPAKKALLEAAEFLESYSTTKNIGSRQRVAKWLRGVAARVPNYRPHKVRPAEKKWNGKWFRIRLAGIAIPTYLAHTPEAALVNDWCWTTTFSRALKWRLREFAEKRLERVLAWHRVRGDDMMKVEGKYYIEEEK